MDDLVRAVVLVAAAIACQGQGPDAALAAAPRFAQWASGLRVVVETGEWTVHQDPAAGAPRRTVITEGGAVQLPDDMQVTDKIRAFDAKNNVIPGTSFTFTPADPAIVTVVTGEVDLDGKLSFTVVAGNPGSTTVDVSDIAGSFRYTLAYDVTTAEVARVEVEEGVPVHQPGFEPPVG